MHYIQVLHFDFSSTMSSLLSCSSHSWYLPVAKMTEKISVLISNSISLFFLQLVYKWEVFVLFNWWKFKNILKSNHKVKKEMINLITISTYQPTFGFNKRSVLTIHLVVETTCIAQVVTISIPSPQWGRGSATVNTLTAL